MIPSDERRHFSRIAIDGRVRIGCDEHRFETQLVDISLNGALVRRPTSWQGGRGTGCRIELLDDDGEILIAMEGSVAHLHPDVVGFHCESIDLESISHLKRLLQLNLGDEALLQRELNELIAVQEAG